MSNKRDDYIISSYERAMIASRLVNRCFFDNTQKAVYMKDREGARELFIKTCKDAKIPKDLAEHMWNIIDAAYDPVYSKMSSPVW